ncbi:hypothetical protein [uncultured Jannaschia sp.]|uniref:hypothetical protein n=1 Tax=uncultured Jannaschia sp. TaxID=293347 RepID=UPI00260F00BC|nr:hypothetical protein [uncultured Jannaschia sp.]
MPRASTSDKAPQVTAPAVPEGLAMAMAPWFVATHATAAWIEGLTQMNGEWARFMGERLGRDAETQHAIFGCSSPLEAQQVATAFMRKTMEDYMTEAVRFSAMGARVVDAATMRTKETTSCK